MLPIPPSEKEKYSYCAPNPLPFFLSGVLCLGAFLYCSYWFIQKSPWLIPYTLFCLIYLSNVGFASIGSLFATRFDQEKHEALKAEAIAYQPSVDVFLPSCGEPLTLLSNNFRAIKAMEYPDLRVWVLDDAGNEELRLMAELYGFGYLSRPNKGELKKSGNMRYAFERTCADLILVFDADFAPRPDFLKETVPYFVDPAIAIVQTPQFFQHHPDQSRIERGATYLQEVFHRLIQNFRDRWGASVCTGSCAVYRRAALEPFGGSYPVERSEDVNTGLSVLRTGWKIKYLPLVLATGLSPDTVEALFHQHYRWCSGSIHLVTSRLFWAQPNVSLWGKLSYLLSILYYTTSGCGAFLFSAPTLINVWLFPDSFGIANYSLIAPSIIFATMVRGWWAANPWGLAPLTTAFAASYTHLIALTDVLFGNVAPWVPTGAIGKSTGKTRFDRFVLVLAILPVIQTLLLLAGLIYHRDLIMPGATIFILNWFGISLFLQIQVLRHIDQDQNGTEVLPTSSPAPKPGSAAVHQPTV